MNNKKSWIIVIISLSIIILIPICIRVINLITIYIQASKVSEFDMDKDSYLSYIQNDCGYELSEYSLLKEEKIVGPVNTPKEAKKQAEKIFMEVLGKEIAEEKKPYQVAYDKNSKVWHVSGHSYPNWLKGESFWGILGGDIHILITQEEGKVLCIWAGK